VTDVDYSATNLGLWNIVVQLGIIALCLLFSHFLRRKVAFVRKSLIPTAVLAGFIMLAAKSLGFGYIDPGMLEKITYHGIAVGFIAMSLQVVRKGSKNASGALVGAKSGALIVSTYTIQGIMGLIVSLALFFTFMPDMFAAAGVLLPMGFGQGPGQANNVGNMYEASGFVGGQAFGLSIAAAGYLCACIIGVIYINILNRKGKLRRVTPETDISGSVTVELPKDEEQPLSESLDRLSIQVAMILLVYLVTFLFTYGLTALLKTISPGLADSVSSILWGFNFITGSLFAMLLKVIFKGFRKWGVMKHQYSNNYLLSRLSGLAFDLMIVAGIASINIENLSGLWVPFGIMVAVGATGTLIYLKFMCKRLYPEYPNEALMSMYGMLTGTISSGVLLLREIDGEFKTPAANNLILGTGFGIAFGAPMLILVGMASKSLTMTYITFGLLFIYLAALMSFMLFFKGKKRKQ